MSVNRLPTTKPPVSRHDRVRRHARGLPVRIRHPRRSTQRRQVDPAQPHPRREGVDRLRQAPDHPHPDPRGPRPTRGPDRVRRHPGHPQAPDARSASASTQTATQAASRGRRRVSGDRRHRRPIGRGDAFVAETLRPRTRSSCVNKIDMRQARQDGRAAGQGGRVGLLEPTSRSRRAPARASTSWSTHLIARLPEGPQLYPDDMVTDMPDAFWVAELVREQLLAITREELPHSIATRVTEWEWPHIRVRDPGRARLARRASSSARRVPCSSRWAAPFANSCARALTSSCTSRSSKDWQDRPERLGYGAAPDR